MLKLLLILFTPIVLLCDEFEYSLEDYNSTSPTYGLNVWNPEYSGFITMHYFSSQGWAGWTGTFGQLSTFQNELRTDDGYEDVVIIAVGQSNISSFNTNFCLNSDLPLVMDQYPNLSIREQFNGQHKEVVILDVDGTLLGRISLNSGVNTAAKTYIRNILAENYEQFVPGDVNQDTLVNVQDIILIVNMILNSNPDSSGDVNQDTLINVLDVVQVVNMILS